MVVYDIKVRFTCPACQVGTVPVIRGKGLSENDSTHIRWMCLSHAAAALMPMKVIYLPLDLAHVQLPTQL